MITKEHDLKCNLMDEQASVERPPAAPQKLYTLFSGVEFLNTLFYEKTRASQFKKFADEVVKAENERKSQSGALVCVGSTDMFEDSKKKRSQVQMDKARKALTEAKKTEG